MGKSEKPKPCPKGAPGWMVTFGDLMSLLLTFFVLLLSFSSMDVKKFKLITGNVSQAFGVQKSIPVYESPVGTNIISQDFSQSFEEDLIKKLQATVKRYKKADDNETQIEVVKDFRGVILRISGNYIFDSASYIIKPTAWPLLDDVHETFKQMKELELYIEAHTDSQPLNSTEIATNWELSALRAVSIVRYYVEGSNSDPYTLHGVGRGDSVPLFPNNSPLNRMRNRRVEFVFTKTKKTQGNL
ncbi:OmpA family protein [bacterium]|nr:OmpA family protein [bacterium]